MPLDGWAACQGAVSLATGHGFTYFSGGPIVAWPPLCSAYLGLWTAVLGPTGWSLLLANGALVGLQAWLWLRLLTTIARDSGLAIPSASMLILALFMGLFVAIHQRQVYAHNLLYVLLPAYLATVWTIARRTRMQAGSGCRPLVYAILLGVALPLTHNHALVFVGAAALIVAIARRSEPKTALVLAGLLAAIPIAAWGLARLVFDQTGSHYIGLGAGRFSPLAYAGQLLDGPGRLLVPGRLGAHYVAIVLLLAVVVVLARDKKAVGLRFGLGFVLCSSALSYVILNLSWIFDPLSSYRFSLFVALLLAPLAYVTALPIAPRLAKAALVLALTPQLYWTARWAVRQQTTTLAELEYPESFIPPDAFINRGYRDGPPVRTANGVLIAPDKEEAMLGTICRQDGSLKMGADRPCR